MIDTVQPLPVTALRQRCDAANFTFASTAELEPVDIVLGQQRAEAAIEFGVGMKSEGYNLFAMGSEGIGRHTIVRRYLEQQAVSMPPPSDWCYVFNFESPHKPRALRFPAGRAAAFRADMERLVEDLRAAILAAFETEEYRNRRQEIEAEFGERQEHALSEFSDRARTQNVALIRTPTGFGFAPLVGDTVMDPEDYRKLPAAEQKRIEELFGKLQQELEHVLHELPRWRRLTMQRMRELNREVTRLAVNSTIEEMKGNYRELEPVRDYLSEVQEDILSHAEAFRQPKEGESQPQMMLPFMQPDQGETVFRRYAVNVLIDHSKSTGAPIVFEDQPSHDVLMGSIEHIAQMGALVTDFSLIKAGALHRANGGYLILDALKLLSQPFAWDALKRALRSHEIRTQSLGQALSLISTVSLDPQPIPLQLKVVLVGQRMTYYLLHGYDPEFAALFKVIVDFEDDMPRGNDHDFLYARAIAGFAQREKTRALDREAVARVIEHQSREAGDQSKLSVSVRTLVDLLHESNYWAAQARREVIAAADVDRAIDSQRDRAGRIREKVLENIVNGSQLIDTKGSRVGQINGLAVSQLGSFSFGAPQRITARVRMGSGGVIDIEREAQMGGPIHSKGVMILSGYLAGRYAARKPMSIRASLVFEQSYGMVEGDSASCAELYVLLSCLADAPLSQSLAVTGSVNQHGDVQAIGGANEKIEGFFALCQARGLDGRQGVLIPASNTRHLMLRPEVVAAVAAGRFRIYAVSTVDEGISLLTGLAADEIHARVEKRLHEFAQRGREIAQQGPRRPGRPGGLQ